MMLYWSSLLLFLGSVSGQTREERLQNHRVPGDLVPVHYELEFRPELEDETERGFACDSRAEIHFNVTLATNVIILNVDGYDIEQSNVALSLSPGSPTTPPVPTVTGVRINDTESFLYVDLSSELAVGAQYNVTFTYTLFMSTQRRGFYLISYGGAANPVTVAVSAFRPSDAHWAFPCFDEPEYKATFGVTLVRRGNDATVSTMNIAEQRGRGGGWFADIYQRSVVMSPHSLSINVLDISYTYVEASSANGHLIRVWGAANQLARFDLALRLLPRMIDWYESYTGIQFPLGKIDHIGLRGGGVLGARDALGVVTYPNHQLLFDPVQFESGNLLQIAQMLAQQTGIQFFGHYVSPKWWSDAWVNEALVSFTQFFPLQEALNWNATQLEWMVTQTPIMESDAVNTSSPVRVAVARPSGARAAFSPITNLKGASEMRMIEAALGAQSFHTALIRYTSQYGLGVASTDDFWGVLQQQVNTDNIREPDGTLIAVKDKFDPWIMQTNYPVITFNRSASFGGPAQLTQNIWLNPSDQVPPPPSQWNHLWNIPITFFHAGLPQKDTVTDVWMDRERTVQTSASLPAPGNYAVVNVDRMGFYRVLYDDESRRLILADLDSGSSRIPLESKSQLIEDAFEKAQADNTPETAGFDFTRFINNEPEFLIWESVNRQTDYIDFQLAGQSFYSNYTTYYRSKVDPVFATHGAHRPEVIRETRITRRFLGIDLQQLACTYGNPTCISAARDEYNRFIDGTEDLDPDTEQAILCTVVENGDEDDWNTIAAFNPGGDTRLRQLAALACTRSVTQMESYFDDTLLGLFDNRAASYIAATELGRPIVWTHLRNDWDDSPLGLGVRLNLLTIVSYGFNTQQRLNELDAFFVDFPPATGREENTYTAAREIAVSNQNWLNVNGEPLRQWLLANQPADPVQYEGPTVSSSRVLYNMFRNQNEKQNRRRLPRLKPERNVDDDEYFGKVDNTFLNSLFGTE